MNDRYTALLSELAKHQLALSDTVEEFVATAEREGETVGTQAVRLHLRNVEEGARMMIEKLNSTAELFRD